MFKLIVPFFYVQQDLQILKKGANARKTISTIMDPRLQKQKEEVVNFQMEEGIFGRATGASRQEKATYNFVF